MAAIETAILLASGARLPTLGLGVYQTLDPGRTTTAALAAGYRHVDSARIYRNEERCGQAVAAWLAEHPDERVFLTSKITGKEHGTARTRVAVDESVARLSALGLRWVCQIFRPRPTTAPLTVAGPVSAARRNVGGRAPARGVAGARGDAAAGQAPRAGRLQLCSSPLPLLACS